MNPKWESFNHQRQFNSFNSTSSFSLLSVTGGVEHHRDGVGHEQIHRLCPAASADPLCRSLCWHGALRASRRLHAADHLPAVQRPLAHQGPKGRYRGVSAGYLQVRRAERSH